MQNDSKLGLLAGVAGVVVAAVLLSQKPPAAPGPAAQATAPSPAATPASAGPIAKAPAASTAVAAHGRPELEGKTTSRLKDDDE